MTSGPPFIEAFFPAGHEADIVAACQIIFRDEDAVAKVFSALRIEEMPGDRTNYADLMPTQHPLAVLQVHISAR